MWMVLWIWIWIVVCMCKCLTGLWCVWICQLTRSSSSSMFRAVPHMVKAFCDDQILPMMRPSSSLSSPTSSSSSSFWSSLERVWYGRMLFPPADTLLPWGEQFGAYQTRTNTLLSTSSSVSSTASAAILASEPCNVEFATVQPKNQREAGQRDVSPGLPTGCAAVSLQPGQAYS